ncbi:hypothetical protein [Streptomyces sp. NPDC050564]|uniref:hypothetical protein n=1 Tax=Streptomyces sp. NPDC050564 TaxID=3365631 RepID=UPI00379797A1
MSDELTPLANDFVDLYVDAKQPRGSETPLVEAFVALGAQVRVRVWPTRRGPDELHWLFLIALPLQSFLGGFGGRLADDVYRRMQSALRRTPSDQAPGAPRPVVLQDTATGARIVLGPEVDDEAYRKLRALDLARFRHGTLRYDAAEARWCSVSGDFASEGTES